MSSPTFGRAGGAPPPSPRMAMKRGAGTGDRSPHLMKQQLLPESSDDPSSLLHIDKDENIAKRKSIVGGGDPQASIASSRSSRHWEDEDEADGESDDDDAFRRAQRTITQVGDAKQTIDDLKSSLLSYYSHLYSVSGLDIDSRLQQLSSQNIFPTSSMHKSRLKKDIYKYEKHEKKPQPEYLANIPPPNSYENPLEKSRLAPQHKGKWGAGGSREEGKAIPPLEGDETNFYGLLEKGGEDVGMSMKGGTNAFGRDIREMNDGGIYELLSDLQKKCMSATVRLATVGDDICNEIENPNLREWEYTTYPEVRRRPCYGGREELRRHMVTTFADLKSRSEINKRKIAALQSKIKILNMHTNSNMAKLKEDVRIGF